MSRIFPYLFLFFTGMQSFGQTTANISISGTVLDSAGVLPIASAAIKLETSGLTATTDANGKFTLATGGTAIRNADPFDPMAPIAAIRNGALSLSIAEAATVAITAFGIRGDMLSSSRQDLDAGAHVLPLPGTGPGLSFIRVTAGAHETLVKAAAFEGSAPGILGKAASSPSPLAKSSAAAAAAAVALYDVITVTKAGYLKAYLSVVSSEGSDLKIRMLKETSPHFSFFVTSMKALLELSGSEKGFGGDFRFGETGAGSGLRGADKICATIAERSMAASSFKGWRAFLSVTADASGKQVDAISRVGEGPWYDRAGRLLAPKKADLLSVRPLNGDSTIRVDLPNENGIPNHRPDPSKPADDNHHTMTGSTATGTLKSATSTCKDWTTAEASTAGGKPSAGFSWPRSLMSTGTGANWITSWDAPGCGAGIEITNASPGG
ncbi:MAG: hypothetical protein ABIY63_05875, partial [Fibrobacteria bacterium]